MAAAEYTSEVKSVPHPCDTIYRTLSDLSNIEKVRAMLPPEQVKDIRFDADSCTFKAPVVGDMILRIIEREESKCIKLTAEKAPFPVFLWIQTVASPDNPYETKMKLTIRAEINMMMKPMLSKPLQDGVEKLASVLAMLPYNHLA